jgi:hypothetical protein
MIIATIIGTIIACGILTWLAFCLSDRSLEMELDRRNELLNKHKEKPCD